MCDVPPPDTDVELSSRSTARRRTREPVRRRVCGNSSCTDRRCEDNPSGQRSRSPVSPVRVGHRLVVAAVQRFGRRHHPRRLAGRVGKATKVDVCGAGEGHGPFEAAGIAGRRAVFAGEGAVGLGLQREHLPAFGGSVRHVPEPVPTASQRPPTSSNTNVDTSVVSPLRRDAVATHPPERHTERTPQVSVAGEDPRSPDLPYGVRAEVGGVGAGERTRVGRRGGGGGWAVGGGRLRCCETFAAAKTPPPISTAMASRAGMTTRGRRHISASGWALPPVVVPVVCRTGAALVGASWVSWSWIGPAVGWSAPAGGCAGTVGSDRASARLSRRARRAPTPRWWHSARRGLWPCPWR